MADRGGAPPTPWRREATNGMALGRGYFCILRGGDYGCAVCLGGSQRMLVIPNEFLSSRLGIRARICCLSGWFLSRWAVPVPRGVCAEARGPRLRGGFA